MSAVFMAADNKGADGPASMADFRFRENRTLDAPTAPEIRPDPANPLKTGPGPWEADAAARALVPRRQPAPVQALFAVSSLQLKARQEGIPTPVYGLQEVHRKA